MSDREGDTVIELKYVKKSFINIQLIKKSQHRMPLCIYVHFNAVCVCMYLMSKTRFYMHCVGALRKHLATLLQVSAKIPN